MVFPDYEINPQAIERESFRQIRALTDLTGLGDAQQQVAMRVVHTMGLPEAAASVRFSVNACESGRRALAAAAPILCDVEMVRQGLTRRLLKSESHCYLNHPPVAPLARRRGETRSMAAVQFWRGKLGGGIALIGNAPTALFRLLDILQQGAEKPALIIAVPVGFVGAAESKQRLWDMHRALGVECITLLGRLGGSAVAAAICNALLRCNHNEWY